MKVVLSKTVYIIESGSIYLLTLLISIVFELCPAPPTTHFKNNGKNEKWNRIISAE